jgi:hypothetical protein
MKYPSRSIRIEAVQYCITAILLTVAIAMISSPYLASVNSQISACASENLLRDLTISSSSTVFAAGPSSRVQSMSSGYTGLFGKLDTGLVPAAEETF